MLASTATITLTNQVIFEDIVSSRVPYHFVQEEISVHGKRIKDLDLQRIICVFYGVCRNQKSGLTDDAIVPLRN